MTKRSIAVFDFDGTLTQKDTMLMFIRYAKGTVPFIIGFCIFAPMIALMFMRIIDNHNCKQRLLSWFFKGMSYEEFAAKGKAFANKVSLISRQDTTKALLKHQQEGTEVYVVTASVVEWVAPFCERLGVKKVIGTEMEVDENGILTGKFRTHNCHGGEKVRRFLAVEPDRESYFLYAYGDSSGDTEMLALADEGHFVKL